MCADEPKKRAMVEYHFLFPRPQAKATSMANNVLLTIDSDIRA